MFKNKRVINIYQLSLCIIAILTYVSPISKIYYDSGKGVTINVLFNTLNALMLISLLLVAFFATYNLLKDNYESANIINTLCFLSLLFVSINIAIYAKSLFYAISTAYIVLFYELFLLNAIIQINGFVWSFKGFKRYIKKHFIKPKPKQTKQKPQSVLKTELIIKRNAENKPKNTNSESEKSTPK